MEAQEQLYAQSPTSRETSCQIVMLSYHRIVELSHLLRRPDMFPDELTPYVHYPLVKYGLADHPSGTQRADDTDSVSALA